MTSPIKSCVDSKMSENESSDITIYEDMRENDNVDEIEIKAEIGGNEAEQGHSGNLDEYDPSLDILIALRKGIRSYMKHPICNYISYDSLSLQFGAFTASLDSIVILKSIHIAL